MAANPTIYCLENLTDYGEFERLCHDLMALEGYPNIEPLGGFQDKGRDAIHVNQSSITTIFAYSVRDDWRVKLAEDASKISRHGHTCDQLIFVTTAEYTVGQRDEAVNAIERDYGWHLELYGLERLRVLLDTKHSDVRARYPQIFTPSFYSGKGFSLNSPGADHIFVSAAEADHILAEWLVRRLTAEGYCVWYERVQLLGGESYPDDIDEALAERSFCMVALYSRDSASDPEVLRQRAVANNIAKQRHVDFLIPLSIEGKKPENLDRLTQDLTFVPFDSWATGLNQLVRKLTALGCPKPLEDGKQIVTRQLEYTHVLQDRPERIVTNCFRLLHIPEHIYRFTTDVPINSAAASSERWQWAFRKVNPLLYLSFCPPPEALQDEYKLQFLDSTSWRQEDHINGIYTRNLVAELMKKSLQVVCYEKGLIYCPEQRVQYFPWGLLPNNWVKYNRLNGKPSRLQVAGERAFGFGPARERYRYYLAPEFYVRSGLGAQFVAIVRIRLRLSDADGLSLATRKIVSRRKHIGKNWWNSEWLDRTLAVCQYLSTDGAIVCGSGPDRVAFDKKPQMLVSPVGINEHELSQLSYVRSDEFFEDEFEDDSNIQQHDSHA